MHVPELTIVTVIPETVHTFVVWLASVGVLPESTEGARSNNVVEKFRSSGWANTMAWARRVTVMVMLLDVAAL